MTEKQRVKISKFLSKYLRHSPEALGLTLESGGWVAVENLLQACDNRNFPVTIDQLKEVVETNDKQRFAFDETGERIRANQGHSTSVDLELVSQQPPALLYHGTADRNLDSIFEQGLTRQRRHHVHLSADVETARKVGARHGRVVILVIDTKTMHEDGYQFYCSTNGVWLVDAVPTKYLQLLQKQQESQE